MPQEITNIEKSWKTQDLPGRLKSKSPTAEVADAGSRGVVVVVVAGAGATGATAAATAGFVSGSGSAKSADAPADAFSHSKKLVLVNMARSFSQSSLTGDVFCDGTSTFRSWIKLEKLT